MAKFVVRDLNPAVGAEIEGLDPTAELDADTIGALRAAFDARSVLLLRDLDLAPEDQAYLTGLLVGKDAPADRAATVANTQTYANYVTNRDEDGYAPFGELLFHADMMWGENPMEAISLYGVHVDPPSVPTRFASMAYACATLPAELRARVEGLRAVHVTGQQRRGEHKDQLVEVQHESTRSTVKPVIWQHPRTGRELLYVSQQMTAEIEGLDAEESEALLEELFAHLYRAEYVLEHDWRQGDIVVWDNLAAQHARGNVQMEGPERTLRKVIAPVQPDLGLGRPKMVNAGAA
jgi:alpha-ketoglutarate-dependent taurine dioxygenase